MTMANSYTDENGVYRNKLGATDAQQLRHLEYEITSRKSIDILDGNVLGLACSFDLAHLQAIHQYIFQDVYEWAGKIRTKPSSKRAPNGMVTVFAAPDEIVPDWQALARETNAFAAAAGLSFEQKRAALVDIFIEANRIHPFPEGNGRSLQVFLRELAREQSVVLDYAKVDALAWNQASAVSGMHGRLFEHSYIIKEEPDPEPIRKIFAEIVRPALTEVQDIRRKEDIGIQKPRGRGR